MKKLVCIIPIFLIVFSFSSCGGSKEESVVKKPAQHYDGYRLKKETKIDKKDSYNEDGISVSVTDLTYEDVVTKLNLHIKNDTDNQLIVTTANLSVNGLMFAGNLFSEIPAKTEQDEAVAIDNEWLGFMGIEMIADIEFLIKVYDDSKNEIMQSEIILVETDAPRYYAQTYDKSGVELYHANGIKLYARAMQKSELSDDMEIVFYAENDTKNAVSIMSHDVFVNGKAVEPSFVMSVGAEKKAVDTMVFHAEDLVKNKIEEIDSLETKFKAFNDQLELVLETESIRIPLSDK